MWKQLAHVWSSLFSIYFKATLLFFPLFTDTLNTRMTHFTAKNTNPSHWVFQLMISHLAEVPLPPTPNPPPPTPTHLVCRNFRHVLWLYAVLLERYICFAASHEWLANNDNLMDETRAGKCSDFTRPDLISLVRVKLGHGVGVNKQNASGLQ